MISVGLELSGNSIRVAVVDGSRAGAKLTGFDVRRIDAKKGDAEDDIVSVIEEAMKRLGAPRANVVCSIRAQDCMIREILVPFTEDEKIRKTVKYQAENYFTSLSIDDLVIEYSKFAQVDTKSKLLVAGIKKSHIARRLAMLEECGIDPLAIDLDVGALYNAYAHLGVFEGKGAALIVEVMADTLKVGVVEDGKLRLARAIRMRLGSMRLDGGRRKALGDSGEGAAYETAADESARLPVVILDEGDDDAFSLEDSGITETEREGILHRVFMEIDRTVASVQLSHEVELIALTGPSCALDGIEQVFADHFEIEARRIDIATPLGAPPDKRAKGEPSLSLEGVTAVGLALKGLGIDHSGMDFRQEEFVYRGTFGQLKRGLACTLTLLFTLVFLYAFGLKQERHEMEGTLFGVRSMERDLYTVLLPNDDPQTTDPHLPLPRKDDYLGSLQQVQAELQNKFGAGPMDTGAQVSALEILRQFALEKSQVPAHLSGITVMKVSIDPRPSGQSRFICKVADQPAALELARAFEDNELLTGMTREIRPDKEGGYTFEFIVKLREGPR